MKRTLIYLTVIATLFIVSCSDDSISTSDVSFDVKFPESLSAKNPVLTSGTLTLTNVNTGYVAVSQFSGISFISTDVEDGLYNVKIEGEVSYTTQDAEGADVQQTANVRALEENVGILGGTFDLDMQLVLSKESEGFVISEILFSGTQTPEGKQYSGGDKYIEIYNNSSEVLYADGLCIAETAFNTAMYLNQLDPDNRASKTAVSSVYRIPGNGTDYPVQPGETLLICDIAIDHRTANSNSFDLSAADFEWYDDHEYDVDVPEVTNMVKMVSTSASIWSLHNRGFKSYVLFKLDNVTPEQFAINNAYHYDYKLIFGGSEYDMDADAWEVSNDIIIDAVECSTPSDYEWKALNPSLDLTWTHSGDGDDSRYGKSVKRKVSYTENGRVVLLDTNDSAFDFIATAEPSPGNVETE